MHAIGDVVLVKDVLAGRHVEGFHRRAQGRQQRGVVSRRHSTTVGIRILRHGPTPVQRLASDAMACRATAIFKGDSDALMVDYRQPRYRSSKYPGICKECNSLQWIGKTASSATVFGPCE
jgi:hypothetical protein